MIWEVRNQDATGSGQETESWLLRYVHTVRIRTVCAIAYVIGNTALSSTCTELRLAWLNPRRFWYGGQTTSKTS